MTAEEILREIRQLPVEEQWALTQVIIDYLDEVEDSLEPAIEAPPFLSLAGVLVSDRKEITDEESETIIPIKFWIKK